MSKTLPFEKQKKIIMDNFDWEKVHKVMKFLKWTWATSLEDNSVPSIRELKLSALWHLNSLDKENLYCSSSGGLIARKVNGNYYLAFELTSWDCDDYE